MERGRGGEPGRGNWMAPKGRVEEVVLEAGTGVGFAKMVVPEQLHGQAWRAWRAQRAA